MPERYYTNNNTKTTTHGLPTFAHNSRRQIGLSDPDMIEYINQSANYN
jgi:hypothetical protein